MLWATIPQHLRYSPSIWTEHPESDSCFMLTSVFLTFLQCDFLIWRILEKYDAESKRQLIKVAGDILALIQELGSFRRCQASFHIRFAYIVSQHFADSPLNALTNLARCFGTGSPLPLFSRDNYSTWHEKVQILPGLPCRRTWTTRASSASCPYL